MVKTKKIMYYLLPLISAFFIFSFFTGPVAAEDNLMDNNPSNWNVYSNQTIQNAINNASPGDTIIINEGTYNENIIVNKTNLTLKSNGIVTISASDPNQPGIYIDSSGYNTKINGLIISDALYNAGIYLSGTSNSVISGNTIINNGQGIYLDLSTNNIISENNLNNNYNYGVNLVNSSGNILKNNLFTNNWNNLEVTGNDISDYKQDIDISNTINGNSIYFLVEQNGLTYNGISMGYLALISCTNIQINNISITDSSQISLINTTNSVLENCNFRDNYENKIFLLNSSYNTISKVLTTKISLESSNNNIISENDIKCNNSNGISLLNSSNNSIISNAISIGSGPVSCAVSLSTKTLDDSPKNFSDNDNGIYLESSSNNIISQNSLNDNNYNHASGICINSSPNNTITNNVLSNNSYGINLYNSPNNNIIENNVTDNDYGVYIENSSGNILKNNTLVNNDYNFDVSGDDASDYTQDINTTNTINGYPIYYLIEQDGLILDGTSIGYLALISCAGIQVKNINITKNGKGILLLNTTNSKIENNTITDNSGYGIELWNSSNNLISTNNITNNGSGVYLESSLNNNISKNNITNVDYSPYGNSGFLLKNSSKNEITENSITNGEIYVECSAENNLNKNNTSKIILKLSPNNNISENNTSNISIVSSSNNNLSNNIILNNDCTGIYLESSLNCIISKNDITGNVNENNYFEYCFGISLENSSENLISDNNISNYSRGVYVSNSNNNNITNNNLISKAQSFGTTNLFSFWNRESYGLSFDGSSSNNTISGNTVTNNAYGIYFHLTSNNTVNNNILNENKVGILLEESSKNNISKNNISNGTYGILTWPLYSSSGSNNNSISENIITNQSFAEIRASSSSSNIISNNELNNDQQGHSTGIYLDSSSKNTVFGNTISNNHDGIYLFCSQENTINENNHITNNDNGIHVTSANSNIISVNIISNNSKGINIESSTNNKISENVLSNNTYGISSTTSNDNEILNNIINENNNSGIHFDNSSNCLISENTIQSNGTGIILMSSSGIIISKNQITKNDNEGIFSTSTSEITISKNNIVENSASGIKGNFTNSSISENTLENNGTGIIITASSGNTISNNQITKNSGSGISIDLPNKSSSSDNISKNMISENASSGIYFKNCSSISIYTNTIQNNKSGIDFISSSEITISNNSITGNTNSGIKGSLSNSSISENTIQTDAEGINLYNSSNNQISNNTIAENNNSGIFLGNSSNITISTNIIQNNNKGIDLASSNEITISKNNISENTASGIGTEHTNSSITENTIQNNNIGIDIAYSGAIISKNIIIGNTNSGIKGSLSSNSITENTIQNNTKGINLHYSSNNQISNNTIAENNNSGISIGNPWYEYDSSNNVISGNIISNNGLGVHLYGYFSALKGANYNNQILNNKITGNNASGIYLDYSRNNLVSENDITHNNGTGIIIGTSFMGWSSDNTISNNDISENNGDGINLSLGAGITISKNDITRNIGSGISLSTSNNTIAGNNIYYNSNSGIALNNASSNNLYANGITNNKNGISFLNSSKNEMNKCIILNNKNNDVYMSSSNNINTKSTFDESKMVLDNSSLINSWDFYVTVLDMVGNRVEDASVLITNKDEEVIGYGTTNANGLFKLDNENWNTHIQTEINSPYGVHVFYNNGEYLFNNSITQRASGYLMNTFPCNLPFIDPKHDNLLPDGPDEPGPDEPGPDEPGPDEPGPDEPGPDEPGPDEPGPDEPGPGEDIKPPRLYVEIPNMNPDANETAIHYNSKGPQFVYIYNLGNVDTGPVLVHAQIGGIFKVVEIIGEGSITLWDENSSEKEPIVFLNNIPPLGRTALIVIIEAGDDPNPEKPGDTSTADLTVNAVAIRSEIIYSAQIEQKRFTNCNFDNWLEGINYAMDRMFKAVAAKTTVELVKAGVIPFSLGFIFGNIFVLSAEISAVQGVIEIAQSQLNISYEITTQSGSMESKNVRVALEWKEDVPDRIKNQYKRFCFDTDEIEGYAQRIHPVKAFDPNEIIGLSGYGEKGFIPYVLNLPYTIKFENLSNATAPAQKVVITDQLDSDLDWNTFKFGDVSFSGLTIPVWQNIVDLRPNKNLLVKINRNIDYNTGLVTWTFESIDPGTGFPPTDPLIGFLPPNINSPEGNGWVTYDISPKLNLSSGTEIRSKASITFDINDPIETTELLNTIDSQNPISNVFDLTSQTSNTEFEVSWSGNDTNGSGIHNYIIYVSKNNAPYTEWLRTYNTSAIFTGDPGCNYKFFSIAIDNVGNSENAPTIPDAITTMSNIAINQPPVADCGGPYIGNEGSSIIFDASSSSDPNGNTLKYRWDFDNDGVWDTEWLEQPTINHTWNDDHTGTVKLEVSDGELTNEITTPVTVNNVAPIVNAGQNQTINEGDTVNFNGSFEDPGTNDTHTIKWDFGDGTNTTETLTTTHTYTDNGTYNVTLTITDKDNSTGTANLTITINNIAPTVNVGPNQVVVTGDEVNLSGSFTDPGALDTFTIQWDFGDGSPSVLGILNPSHNYYSKGDYNATLTVTDNDGGVGISTLTISVNPITASVNVYPETINLKKHGKWLIAFIKLPTKYNASKIDINSVKLTFGENSVASNKIFIIKNTMLAIFDISKVIKLLDETSDNVNIAINGKILYNGGNADFEGSNAIKIKKSYDPWNFDYWKNIFKSFDVDLLKFINLWKDLI